MRWCGESSGSTEAAPRGTHTAMSRMRAIIRREYGPPDVLRLESIDRPVVAEKDVLVRVRAASVNPLDWHLLTGKPSPIRILGGLPKPTRIVLGSDMAGTVEAAGRGVTQFRPGDEVFGLAPGSLAEYTWRRKRERAQAGR